MSEKLKYCLVPCCKNTDIKNPCKIFIRVPTKESIREQWYKAIKPNYEKRGNKVYVCEDHFNFETDVRNWMEYKLMGDRLLKLKPGVIPHLNLLKNDVDSKVSQEPVTTRQLRVKYKSEPKFNQVNCETSEPEQEVKDEEDQDDPFENVATVVRVEIDALVNKDGEKATNTKETQTQTMSFTIGTQTEFSYTCNCPKSKQRRKQALHARRCFV